MEDYSRSIFAAWNSPLGNTSSLPSASSNTTNVLLIRPSLPSSEPAAQLYLMLLVLVALVILQQLVARPPVGEDVPKAWNEYDWPIIGSSLGFFWQRRDMIVEGTSSSTNGMFSFFVGKKHVISINGEAGRRTFYENKNLNFSAGFTQLLTGIPPAGNAAKRFGWLRYFVPGTDGEDGAWFKYFIRTTMSLINGKSLARKLKVLTLDIRSMCDELASQEPVKSSTNWRVFQPFENLHELIYKLSFRMVGSNDFAEDRSRLRWAISIYRELEDEKNMAKIVFPWLITPVYLKQIYLAARLYLSYMAVITRRQLGLRQDDPIQDLLDRGDSPDDIVKAQIGAIWAAGLTTGATASWMTVLLSTNPECKERCRAEVDAAVSKHRTSTAQSRADILDSLTLQDWESEFPYIGLCIRETVRVSMPGTVFRKNMSGTSIPIGDTGEVIPNGSFIAFLNDNVHMNPEFYPEPQRFNPGRYIDDALGAKNEAHTYVGWGGGRHPCLGSRMAKLEITLAFAYFMASFDFELSDQNGGLNFTVPPMPNRNGHKTQKANFPIYLRYILRAKDD